MLIFAFLRIFQISPVPGKDVPHTCRAKMVWQHQVWFMV